MFMRLPSFVAFMAAALLGLAGCVLDKEEALRDELTGWLELGGTEYFTSTSTCTVALFKLEELGLKEGAPVPVAALETAMARIEADQPVLFAFAGKSPHDISQDVMTADLARGIGLISSGVGPMMDCMNDRVKRGTYVLLTSQMSQLVYIPQQDALLIIYPPEDYALYLRGNV